MSTNTADRLGNRMAANAGGARDLNAFLFGLAAPTASDDVLDLGCGLGHQAVPLAGIARSVVALDISAELLARLPRRPNLKTVCASMDDVAAALAGRRFSLVMATYSLYYSADIARLVQSISADLLATGGRFLTISPDAGNNAEWYGDLGRIFAVPDEIAKSSAVSRARVLPAALDVFSDVRCVRFANPVRYDSLDALMGYYDGCGAYCPADRREAAEAHFASRIPYTITKRALAILGC